MPDEPITEIKIAIAEVRGDLRHLAHDIKNALQKQEAFITRREANEKSEVLEERIVSIESNQSWAVRLIVGAWIAGAGVVAFGKRLFT